MANMSMFYGAAEEYGLEEFSADGDIWTETDNSKQTAARYTSEASPRDSCMEFHGNSWTLGDGITLGDAYKLGQSSDGAGEGIYKDFSVTAGTKIRFACKYKCLSGTMTILLYDQTNSVDINSVDVTAAVWTDYTLEVTAPGTCTTVRVKFTQKSGTVIAGPFLIDNLGFNQSSLATDPSDYTREPFVIGGFRSTLRGRRVHQLIAVHYRSELVWKKTDKDMVDEMQAMYLSGEKLYFDDGEVPPMTDREFVYDTATKNFVGITNPSSTHVAYSDSSASLPSGETDFETTEYSDANYLAVDVDDANHMETTDPTATFYLYHKYELDPGIARADVERLRVKVVVLSDDGSPANTDGAILYGWNDLDGAWVELKRTSSSAKTDLEYSTLDSEDAQRFIDGSDDYVRLLLRSRAARDGANSLSLRTYFVEVEVNENLDLKIDFTNKAILDSNGDVTWVRNLTQGTLLVKDSTYTVGSDGESVTVSSQASGDEIEVKYDRYFEGKITRMPEKWLHGDPGDDRKRGLRIAFETVSESF